MTVKDVYYKKMHFTNWIELAAAIAVAMLLIQYLSTVLTSPFEISMEKLLRVLVTFT